MNRRPETARTKAARAARKAYAKTHDVDVVFSRGYARVLDLDGKLLRKAGAPGMTEDAAFLALAAELAS